MTKILKVDLSSGQKIINPFRTSRDSASTNPFKYQNFEGNAIDPLVCADVLVSFKAKPSRLKMITSSVAGMMTKNVTEPIKQFVNRVKVIASKAWEYSKNTNISDLPGIRGINSVMKMDIVDIGRGFTDSISGFGKKIAQRCYLEPEVTGLGESISHIWSGLISKIHTNKINSETSVDELRRMWEAEIALAKEVA